MVYQQHFYRCVAKKHHDASIFGGYLSPFFKIFYLFICDKDLPKRLLIVVLLFSTQQKNSSTTFIFFGVYYYFFFLSVYYYFFFLLYTTYLSEYSII
jgi:hypothetical protein